MANMWEIAQDIIASYEARVAAMGRIIEDTHKMLENFRQEREQLHNGLRETLANGESLRRKDFDAMMERIRASQKAKEDGVRERVWEFLEEQKRMASKLKEVTAESQARLSRGEQPRLGEFKSAFSNIRAEQEEREKQVREILEGFRSEQEEKAARMRELLQKGRSLRIKEVKAMLKDFGVQQDGRRKQTDEMATGGRLVTRERRLSRAVVGAASSEQRNDGETAVNRESRRELSFATGD